MCLLEDKAHEGHARQNLKDLLSPVKSRLSQINDGLSAKRRQMEQSAEEIQREIIDIGEHVTKYSIPEIHRFAKLLEKAVHIDKKCKIETLKNLMNYKVSWSLKEIDGL